MIGKEEYNKSMNGRNIELINSKQSWKIQTFFRAFGKFECLVQPLQLKSKTYIVVPTVFGGTTTEGNRYHQSARTRCFQEFENHEKSSFFRSFSNFFSRVENF